MSSEPECAACGLCFCEWMDEPERPCAFCLICRDVHESIMGMREAS